MNVIMCCGDEHTTFSVTDSKSTASFLHAHLDLCGQTCKLRRIFAVVPSSSRRLVVDLHYHLLSFGGAGLANGGCFSAVSVHDLEGYYGYSFDKLLAMDIVQESLIRTVKPVDAQNYYKASVNYNDRQSDEFWFFGGCQKQVLYRFVALHYASKHKRGITFPRYFSIFMNGQGDGDSLLIRGGGLPLSCPVTLEVRPVEVG